MSKLTYYEILRVREDAEKEIIDAAYKALCRKYHPDLHPDDEECVEMMKLVNEAYDTLKDEEKRARYDETICFEEDVDDYESYYEEEGNKYIDYREEHSKAYKLIDDIASSNAFTQGISGIFGTAISWATDGYAVLKYYVPMVRDIQSIYDKRQSEGTISQVIKGMIGELIEDIILDKTIGAIPIVGAYFNAKCATALTWRLGTIYSIMSIFDEQLSSLEMSKAIEVIRLAFPQESRMKYTNYKEDHFVWVLDMIGHFKSCYDTPYEALTASKYFFDNHDYRWCYNDFKDVDLYKDRKRTIQFGGIKQEKDKASIVIWAKNLSDSDLYVKMIGIAIDGEEYEPELNYIVEAGSGFCSLEEPLPINLKLPFDSNILFGLIFCDEKQAEFSQIECEIKVDPMKEKLNIKILDSEIEEFEEDPLYENEQDLEEIYRYLRYDRGVKWIMHFTTLDNVPSIMEYGIVSRNRAESLGGVCLDGSRYDGHTEYSCFTLSYPNYKMLFKEYKDNPNKVFVVLKISIDALLSKEINKAMFLRTNAASNEMRNIIDECTTLDDAKAMFYEPSPLYRENVLNIPDYYTTNPQAELMIDGVILPEYIKGIDFRTLDDMIEYIDRVEGYDLEITNEIYNGPRCDYTYW